MGASAEASCTITGLANSWLYVYPSGINLSIPSGAARVRRQEQYSQQAQLAATIDMINLSGARRLNTPPVHQPFKINCLSPSYWAEPVAWKGGFWAHDTVSLISPHLLVSPIRQFLLSGTFQACVPRKKPWEGSTSRSTWVPFWCHLFGNSYSVLAFVSTFKTDPPRNCLLAAYLLSWSISNTCVRTVFHNRSVEFLQPQSSTAPMVSNLLNSLCSKPIWPSPFAVHPIVASSRQPFRRETYPGRSQVRATKIIIFSRPIYFATWAPQLALGFIFGPTALRYRARDTPCWGPRQCPPSSKNNRKQ